MEQNSRSPERLLDEIYETGRRLMEAKVRERRHGHSSIAATAGDNPPSYEEPEEEVEAVRDERALRGRFQALTREFVDRLEAL